VVEVEIDDKDWVSGCCFGDEGDVLVLGVGRSLLFSERVDSVVSPPSK
jgi:hypothetical protein